MLLSSGFAPVLAHPVSVGFSKEEWEKNLPMWKDLGLLGLEVYHPDQDEDFSKEMNNLAKKFEFTPTAGSDFHGANKKTPLTWVKGRSPLGAGTLAALRERLALAVGA
jgi:predicted metal-dependent phosphoesterase TrpH